MLKLGKPIEIQKIRLAAGAVVELHAASAVEMGIAKDIVGQQLMRALADPEAMKSLSIAAGLPSPEGERFYDMLGAIMSRLALVEVARLCISRWAGIGDDEGKDVPVTRPWIALLLRDPEASSAIAAALGAEAVETS